jgi:hypothetical protein
MREEEYRHRIDWLWTRAQEFQIFAKSIHHHKSRAAMVRLAQTYANAACELEDVLERKLSHERGIRRPDAGAAASRGDRVDGQVDG